MFDTGNTGFMLVATSLVMLMTPGLAFFYGGLVGRKNVLVATLVLPARSGERLAAQTPDVPQKVA